MTRLHQLVRRTLQRQVLLPAGSRVLVALSGGSDSVALTFLLRDCAKHGGFELAGLAHLNHQLRESAARDERFCRDLAARLELPLEVQSADVRGRAAADHLSIEDSARTVRYEFLETAAVRLGADRIAVGHTQDDQAETFLMKLTRGAGLTGLGGVYPQKGRVVRPLLEVSRADLRDYLRGLEEPWVEDETNDDLDNPRNRIRHIVIPELDRALGGDSRPSIGRSAALLREDGFWLDELAAEQFPRIATAHADGIDLDASALAAMAAPLRRRVLLRALRQMARGREVGHEHVESTLMVLAGKSGGADVPGARVELRRKKLVLLDQKVATK